MKSPYKLTNEEAKTLSRFFIENNATYSYNKFTYLKKEKVVEKFQKCIGSYTIFSSTEDAEINQTIIDKLLPHFDAISKEFSLLKKTNITKKDIMHTMVTAGITLTDQELQYLLLVMYRQSHDIQKMKCSAILQLLEKDYEEENLEPENEETKDEGKIPHSAPVLNEELNDANNEEKTMVEVAQKAFIELATQIINKGIDAKSHFNKYSQTKNINGEEIRVIRDQDFMKAVSELDLKFESNTFDCLIKVLRANEESNEFLRVDDLEQILNEYKELESKVDKQIPVDLNGLDELTIVIMYELMQFLNDNGITLRQLLNECIYMHPAKSEQINDDETEVVKFEHLLDILTNKIGIETEGHDMMNIKAIFKYSDKEPQLMVVPKMDYVIQQLRANKEFNEVAQNIYSELVTKQDDIAHEEDLSGKKKKKEVNSN